MKIIDTHAHLDQVQDVDQALKEAARCGVEAVVAVGVDLAANQKNLNIQARVGDPKIYVALGIHPQSLPGESVEESLDFIRKNVGQARAVGEVGLDFWYKHVRKDEGMKKLQKDVFARQLKLAKEFDLPVIIHSRGAWADCVAMVKESGIGRGVFHWFSGPLEILKEILELGFLISATPSLAYSPQARAAVEEAPLDRILIETDTPVFYKNTDLDGGFTAGPKDVVRTLNLLAELKKIPPQEAVTVLDANARDVFGLNP